MVTYCSHAVFLDSDIAFYWVFCRWNEVTRRIEMWISILELNELGEYAAVELHQAKDVNTGGIFQLRQVLSLCFMFSLCPTLTISLTSFLTFIFPLLPPPSLQGHSRRVQVTVKPVQHSGTLPLMVEAILSVSIGCITARSTKLQRGLDSYQVRQI
jgi:kinesin family protein 13